MRISLLALAACTVVNYASAAPMGVVVISTPKANKELTNIEIERVMDRFEAWRLSTGKFVPVAPGIVNTNLLVDEADNAHHIPHRIKLHNPSAEWDGKPKAPCGQRKGVWVMKKKMRLLMNKLRTALGLPIVEYSNQGYPHHVTQDAPHPHPHHTHFHGLDEHELESVQSGFGQYASTGEPFIVRFTRAVNTLSPWEGRAVTFVLGMGLGVLIRMLVVFAILIVRGRKAGRFCERRRARRAARLAAREAAIAAARNPNAVAPPAYSDASADEKRPVVNASDEKTIREKVVHVYTVEPSSNGGLDVVWKHVDNSVQVSPASEFHAQCPEKLLEFYEGNLKFRPIENIVEDDKVAQV